MEDEAQKQEKGDTGDQKALGSLLWSVVVRNPGPGLVLLLLLYAIQWLDTRQLGPAVSDVSQRFEKLDSDLSVIRSDVAALREHAATNGAVIRMLDDRLKALEARMLALEKK